MNEPRRLLESLSASLRFDSHFWRRAFAAGVEHGPEAFVRYSPPAFGWAFAAALPEMRARVRDNLRLIYGKRPPLDEVRDIAKVFSTYASAMTETMMVGAGRGFPLHRQSTGTEAYFEAAEAGRGVIMATAHTAGWEIAGHVLAGIHRREVVVVMQRERDQRARAISDALRQKSGFSVVHLEGGDFDALTLLGHLRRGAALAMQVDRVAPGTRSRMGRLFGVPWQVPEGLLKLAAASGAPIVPIFMHRNGFYDYEAKVLSPIVLPRRPSPRRPSPRELDDAAQAVLDALASFLREHPTQWFHFVARPPAGLAGR